MIHRISLLIIAACLFVGLIGTRAAAADPPFVVVGVYFQPASSFPKWKARGINAVITDKSKPDFPAETAESRAAYFRAAADAGLWLIIGPDPNGPVKDLAHNQPDEPENWGKVTKRSDGSFDWPATTAKYVAEYNRLKAISPTTPVFGNFNGNPLGSARETDTNPRNVTLPIYREFAKGADWVSADSYVRARGRDASMYSKFIGTYLDRFDSIAPGKPKFAVIEVCDQGLTPEQPPAPTAHPTASEVRAQMWIAMIHGAKGIAVFPLKVGGGFQWDNVPLDVAAAMPGIFAEAQKFAPFILRGTLTRNAPSEPGAAQEGTWTLAGSGVLKVRATFAAGVWTVAIDESGVIKVDAEKEALRERLRRVDQWIESFPRN